MLLSMMMNRKLKIGKNIYYLIFPRFHLVVLDYLFTFVLGINKIQEINPDAFFIQEIDINSKRSFNVNELQMLRNSNESNYNNSYACNFKAACLYAICILVISCCASLTVSSVKFTG